MNASALFALGWAKRPSHNFIISFSVYDFKSVSIDLLAEKLYNKRVAERPRGMPLQVCARLSPLISL